MNQLIGLVLLAFTIGNQQGPPATLDGKWTVSVAAGRDANASGRTRSRNAHETTMTLVVKGEEVSGTWQTRFEEQPWELKGTWKAGRLDLSTAERDLQGTKDGKKVPVPARWIIRGSFKGATLGGTCSLILNSDKDDPLWTGWTAVRK